MYPGWFSIIAQVIIECARSDWSRITSYLAIITPREVINNTEALIFKMATARFLKMKENAVALIIT